MQSGGGVLILGAFNYKETVWDAIDPHGRENIWRFNFLERTQNFLHQHLSAVARARYMNVPSKLDLV